MTQTIAAALEQGASLLKPCSDGDAGREARSLLAHVLGGSAISVLAVPDRLLTPAESRNYNAAIAARCDHQPISQILGRRAFWDHDFVVSSDVLDPRPDTELLVELALVRSKNQKVLDLGTGSGCILCSVLYANPQAVGVGADISPKALIVAKRNAAELDLGGRVEFVQSSWFEKIEGAFDMILSNPPYVTAVDYQGLAPGIQKWEPEIALTDGLDGLQAYRNMAASLDQFLADGGLALFEHGSGQAVAVRQIFQAAGFSRCRSYQDLNGKDRVVSVER